MPMKTRHRQHQEDTIVEVAEGNGTAGAMPSPISPLPSPMPSLLSLPSPLATAPLISDPVGKLTMRHAANLFGGLLACPMVKLGLAVPPGPGGMQVKREASLYRSWLSLPTGRWSLLLLFKSEGNSSLSSAIGDGSVVGLVESVVELAMSLLGSVVGWVE